MKKRHVACWLLLIDAYPPARKQAQKQYSFSPHTPFLSYSPSPISLLRWFFTIVGQSFSVGSFYPTRQTDRDTQDGGESSRVSFCFLFFKECHRNHMGREEDTNTRYNINRISLSFSYSPSHWINEAGCSHETNGPNPNGQTPCGVRLHLSRSTRRATFTRHGGSGSGSGRGDRKAVFDSM